LLLVACAGALVVWWSHPPDPAADLAARSSPLAYLARVPAPELGPRAERWWMIGASGDTVTGIWRTAPPVADAPSIGAGALLHEPEWSIVILGGIGTDDRAALLVPDSLPVAVLAVSWPWSGPRRMQSLEFVARLPAMHEALLLTPGAVARAVEAAQRASPGGRVALVGASLGAAPTMAAMRLANPDALILIDGAADLPRLLRSEISRALGGGVAGTLLAPPAAALGGRLLWSLEPARHAEALRRTPVLLLNAAEEERYPPACVERLHSALPGATRAIHPGGHLRVRHVQIAPVVDAIWRWVRTLP
jgi:hypothetical protein